MEILRKLNELLSEAPLRTFPEELWLILKTLGGRYYLQTAIWFLIWKSEAPLNTQQITQNIGNTRIVRVRRSADYLVKRGLLQKSKVYNLVYYNFPSMNFPALNYLRRWV